MSDDKTQTALDGETMPVFTVTTDAFDYAPGTIATFTAMHLVLGGTVQFSVAHIDPGPDGIVGNADDKLTHDLSGTTAPWSVTDGGLGDLDGNANGVVVTSWNVGADALDQTFQLTATDSGGATATATFTDAVSVNFRQAANNDGEPGGLGDINWITSILQSSDSVYREGMSVMQRVLLDGFVDAGGDKKITLTFH